MAQKKYTTEQKLEIIERCEKGESRNSISKKTGISTITIKSWLGKKQDLIETLFEESRNKDDSGRKKRYGELLKKFVVSRVMDGESVYKLSHELGIPYLTIKNWVVVTQNSDGSAPSVHIPFPNTDEVIISDEEKEALREMLAKNAGNHSSAEDSILLTVERQNAEIADLRKQITELEDEIMMLKKSAVLLAKQVRSEENPQS